MSGPPGAGDLALGILLLHDPPPPALEPGPEPDLKSAPEDKPRQATSEKPRLGTSLGPCRKRPC